MIYWISQKLLELSANTAWADTMSFLRLFRYITVRSAGAAMTALALSWWLGPKIIRWLKRLKFGQQYADKAEEVGGLPARITSSSTSKAQDANSKVHAIFLIGRCLRLSTPWRKACLIQTFRRTPVITARWSFAHRLAVSSARYRPRQLVRARFPAVFLVT